jgi:hypothetical protein
MSPVAPASTAVTDLNADKLVVRPEAAVPPTSANPTPALPVATESPPPPRLDPGQPPEAGTQAVPVDQVTPALVGLPRTADGAQTVTVRLQPAELGQVQIRVDQSSNGSAHVDIIAERPETLALLQRDEPRLQQALDQAGVLSTGRSVSFQIAAPATVAANVPRPDSAAAGSGGSGQGQSGGAWRQSGDGQQQSGNGPESEQGQARARWFRAGLDITA